MHNNISIRGAREHNLKNINIDIPKNKFVCITGLSGSGKSTLAFDTIYAEGQRRYVESLSAYARQFLGLMNKPDVDSIEGLSPAISIEQKTTSKNPRSTVGTVTEIYDYLRLLYARIGTPHCPICGHKIERQSAQQITHRILNNVDESTTVMILAPLVQAKKGTYEQLYKDMIAKGFVRAITDNKMHDLQNPPQLDRYVKHTILVVVDRLKVSNDHDHKTRVTESIEQALSIGQGTVVVDIGGKQTSYSQHSSCPNHDISYSELEPRMFSFNSPFGACPDCHGLGFKQTFDVSLIIPDETKSLADGAIKAWNSRFDTWRMREILGFVQRHGIDPFKPWKSYTVKHKDLILYGKSGDFEGVIPLLDRLYKQTDSDRRRQDMDSMMTMYPCDTCKGKRLKPEPLSVLVGGYNIVQCTDLSITRALEFIKHLKLTQQEQQIAKMIIKEITDRLSFLDNVGLGYLTLSRSAGTLSGGEAQRIRLATQIGANLTGVIYVLDEPSIGLHQRDNDRLIETLKQLRDLGNTLLVVEHDEETMLASDLLIDIGPGAGIHGGHIVACAPPSQIASTKQSLTGQYLSGVKKIEVPKKRRSPKGWLSIQGASQHNLKKVNASIPLGVLSVVSGVSGSGKSTLINATLVPALLNTLYKSHHQVGEYKKITGIELIDKVIQIDQSPIGRTPRSNPATYTKVFGDIRELFASTQQAKSQGYEPGRFSFNVPGGRCESCQGDGVIKIEMHFLPDVYVMCEECKGKRYNSQTLDVLYKGKNISDVLEMSVEEALEFFNAVPRINRKLATLVDVGLDYIKLGQPATTLSGGEAQRVKLTAELAKRATGTTLYVLDEPTTGLHFEDVRKLLDVLNRLVKKGNTVVVIEHNLDVIKSADYIIDMGPEGGDAGGQIIACGTPEQIAQQKSSYTGKYLKNLL